jgi:uncharacterized protein with GYD domain
MPLYMYQCAYTPESIAAQIKEPQDRIERAAQPLVKAIGGKLLAAGYAFGDYDITVIYEAPDDQAAAALALVAGAGGAVKAAKTTKLLSGQEWVGALRKAQGMGSAYRPA